MEFYALLQTDEKSETTGIIAFYLDESIAQRDMARFEDQQRPRVKYAIRPGRLIEEREIDHIVTYGTLPLCRDCQFAVEKSAFEERKNTELYCSHPQVVSANDPVYGFSMPTCMSARTGAYLRSSMDRIKACGIPGDLFRPKEIQDGSSETTGDVRATESASDSAATSNDT